MENNYISTVLSKIKENKTKEDIRAELEDHYNERVEYYIRIGYEKEIAETKANAHFGDEAEIVGEQLENINVRHIWGDIIFTVINVLFFAFMFVSLIGAGMLDAPFGNSLIGSFLSLFFTFFAFIELFVALRKKSAYLAGLGVVGTAFFALFFKGYYPAIFGYYKLFKGEAGKLLDLMMNYNWKSANTAVNILCVLFYLFCIGLFVYAAILSIKFQHCKYKKKHIKREKRLKLTVAVTAVFILFSFVLIFITPANDYTTYDVDGFYVIESDEKIDPSEIENYDTNFLRIGWDFGDEYAEDDNDTFIDERIFNAEINIYDDDTDIVYNTYVIYGEFQPTKKYICIVPVKYFSNGYDAVFDGYEWVDTSQEFLFVSDCYNDLGSIVQYKIRILPMEAQ